MAENFGASFTIDISNLKKGLTQANRLIKETESEFRASAAALGAWDKSEQGLEKRITSLRKIIELQKTKVNALKQEYERLINNGLDPASAQAVNLRTQINKETEALNKNERELSQQTDALKKLKESEKGAADQAEKLTDKVDKQERELKELKNRYADVVSAQGKSSAEAKELAGKISTLSGELNENKSKLKDAKDAADQFDKTLKDSSGKSGGISSFQVALGNLEAQAIQKVIQGLKDVASYTFEAFKAVDDGQDEVIKATGATGSVADDLIKSYGNVATSIKGDFTNIGNTLGQVNTRFGYTGTKLEDATKRFLKFSEVTGVDAAEAVRLVARALENSGENMDNYGDLLDKLAKASQVSGIDVSNLAEKVTRYGATMRELGFDMNDTIAIMAQFESAGVNTETAFTGLQTAVKNWAKEGKNSKDEFAKAIKEIQDAPSKVERTQKALDIFGKKAGTELADAISTGRIEYSGFIGDLQNSKGTVEDTYNTITDELDDVDLALQQVKFQAGKTGEEFVKTFAPYITGALKTVQLAMASLPGAFQKVGEVIKTIFAGIWNAIQKVVDGISWAFNKTLDLLNGVREFDTMSKSEATKKALGGTPLGNVLDTFTKLRTSKDNTTGVSTWVPSVRQMATGGIVRRATAAVIGEAGAEAVVPLERDTGWLDMLAEKLASKTSGVVVNQTNNYSAAHSRYEIYKSQQATAKAVKLALMGG